MRGEGRELDREHVRLEREVKRIEGEIKKAAKAGNMVRVLLTMDAYAGVSYDTYILI